MKNMLVLLFSFLTATAVAQQDTLAKYSINELLDKSYLDTSKSKIYGEEVLERNPSDSAKAIVFIDLADYQAVVVGDYTAAVHFCKKSIVFSKKANYKEHIMIGLSKLGAFYAVLNENDKVLPLLEALKEYRFEKNYEIYNNEGLIYYLMGDFKKSISIYKTQLQMAENEAKKKGITEDVYNNMKVLIETTYASLGNAYDYQKQVDSASFYIDKIEENENKLNQNYLWFAKAFNLILRNDYDGAIAYMDKKYVAHIKNSKANNYQYLYYKAICYQQKGDYQKGLDFANEALKNKTPMLTFQNFELECYTIAADCAEKLGRHQEAFAYNKKYIEISKKANYAQKAAFMAKLYEQNEISPLKKELASTSDSAKMLFWGLGITGIAAGYLAFAALRARREKKKFLAIIERLENKNTLKTAPETLAEPVASDEPQAKESAVQKNISPETESAILKKLQGFEENLLFLDPGISLGTLAQDFETNTTYITYVVKKHKNDNLANYVNKLRIEYIIEKMASQPEYAKYTIEYLAQQCGFSSYISFKRIFNKETGMDPSKFIAYLKNTAKQTA